MQSWGELQNDTLERGEASSAVQHEVDGHSYSTTGSGGGMIIP